MNYAYYFVDILFNVLSVAIFARVLLSWFPVNSTNVLVRILFDITEPILAPLRRVIPAIGMIDISPVVALLALQVIRMLLLASLSS